MANKVLNTRIVTAQDKISNLEASTKIWLKGEVVLGFDDDDITKITMKIGDGLHTWSELKKFSAGAAGSGTVLTATVDDTTDVEGALSTLGVTEIEAGTFLILTSTSGGTMGYVYTVNEETGVGTWQAFAGNVLAENVYFSNDIVCAGSYTQVGNVSKAQNGTYTIPSTGKSLKDVMQTIFTKELQPTKTDPAVSITFSQAGSYEVGTTVSPSYSASLSAGSYTYGPATGITASTWEVTDTDGNTSSSSSDDFPSFVVGDSTAYSITANATYAAGTVAKTNLGNTSNPEVKIAAGTKSKTSGKVTGYRSFFYGVLNTSSSTAFTSSMIRGLTNGKAYDGSKSFTISVNGNTSAKRIVVAIPHSSTRSQLTSVLLTSALNSDITSLYTKKASAVLVDDARGEGNSPVAYDVWVYEPSSIDSGEVHAITLG